ncbi:MAG TPA: HD domain-containing protein [Bryobacteraceae bacterium]|jgi:(p)ppGpp synthase/HD superfamily hydrolase|nr:HD domain-containing protein [Bryobacteraceae bacterium]
MAQEHDSADGKQALRDILAAARFAAEKHAGQKRKGAAQEPYINHLIEVAELVAYGCEQSDPNLVMAAFLHDTIEDTGVSRQDLSERFGEDVASLVAEVTDDKSLPSDVRKARQVDHAPELSARAQTLKLADKISNLRSILVSPPAGWGFERKREYFDWGKQVVDRLRSPNPLLKQEFDRVYQSFPARQSKRG